MCSSDLSDFELLSSKLNTESLFNLTFTYNVDFLKETLGSILKQIQANSDSIAILQGKSINPPNEKDLGSVSKDTDLKSRIEKIEKNLQTLEKNQHTETSNITTQPPASSKEFAESKNNEIENAISELRNEMLQRFNKLEIDVQRLKIRSNQQAKTSAVGDGNQDAKDVPETNQCIFPLY